MTAERRGDLDAFVLDEVHRRADVVDGAQLQHEMMQPLRRGKRNQRQGVMARVAMQENHRHAHRTELHVDSVADTEAEAFAIETQALLNFRRGHHDVTDALIAGDETSNRAWRMEWFFELDRWAAEDLTRDAVRIGEANHLGHPTRPGFLG